jgi:DNA-binding transcriptional LysR family regulator
MDLITAEILLRPTYLFCFGINLVEKKKNREISLDTLRKLEAFMATADKGTFSEASRAIGVSPSVIMKRIDELEDEFGVALFSRSTRRVQLTDIGQLYLPKVQQLIRDYDDLRSGALRAPGALEGSLRIKALTVPTLLLLGRIFADFQAQNSRLSLTVITSDFAGNPLEEAFDLAIGIDESSYEGVFEEALHSYPRVACASPSYLKRRGAPQHPQELINHECIAFSPAGTVWSFQTPRGRLGIDVHPRFSTTNAHLLNALTADGKGIAMLSLLAAKPALKKGTLVQVLPNFPVAERTLKVMIPDTRIKLERVQALLGLIKDAFATDNPWPDVAL